MAKITPDGMSGILGKAVYYVVDGQQRIRTKPSKRKRKKNKLNTVFGDVTRNGTPMVGMIKSYKCLKFKFSVKTYNNMRAWIRHVQVANPEEWNLQTTPNYIGQLNAVSDLRDFTSLSISVSNSDTTITASLPSFNPVKDIRTPLHTTKINFKLVAVYSPYSEMGGSRDYAIASHKIENKDAIIDSLEFLLTPHIGYAKLGNMVMIVLALEFENNKGEIMDEKYLPAGAVAMGRVG